jgi:hypothetical protein
MGSQQRHNRLSVLNFALKRHAYRFLKGNRNGCQRLVRLKLSLAHDEIEASKQMDAFVSKPRGCPERPQIYQALWPPSGFFFALPKSTAGWFLSGIQLACGHLKEPSADRVPPLTNQPDLPVGAQRHDCARTGVSHQLQEGGSPIW